MRKRWAKVSKLHRTYLLSAIASAAFLALFFWATAEPSAGPVAVDATPPSELQFSIDRPLELGEGMMLVRNNATEIALCEAYNPFFEDCIGFVMDWVKTDNWSATGPPFVTNGAVLVSPTPMNLVFFVENGLDQYRATPAG